MFVERDGTNRKRKENNAACASLSSLNGTLFTRRQAHMCLYMCTYVNVPKYFWHTVKTSCY